MSLEAPETREDGMSRESSRSSQADGSDQGSREGAKSEEQSPADIVASPLEVEVLPFLQPFVDLVKLLQSTASSESKMAGDLRARLTTAQNELISSEEQHLDEISKLSGEIEELNAQLVEQIKRIHELSKDLEGVQQTLKEARSENTEKSNTLKMKEEDAENWKKEKNELEDRAQRLQKDKKILEKKMSDLQVILESTTSSLEIANETIKSNNVKLGAMEEHFQSSKFQLENNIQQRDKSISQLTNAEKIASDSLKTKEKLCLELKAQIDSLQEEKVSLLSKLDASQENFKIVNPKVGGKQEIGIDKRANEDNEDIAVFKSQAKTLQMKLRDSETELIRAELHARESKCEHLQLQEEHKDLKADFDSKEDESRALKEKIKYLNDKIKDLVSGTYAPQNQNDENGTCSTSIQCNFSDSDFENGSLRGEKKGNSLQIHKRISQQENQILEYQNSVNNLEGKVAALTSEHSTLDTQYQALISEKDTIDKKMEGLLSKEKRLEKVIEQQTEELHILKRQQEDLHGRCVGGNSAEEAKLREDLADLEGKYEESQAEVDHWMGMVHSFTMKAMAGKKRRSSGGSKNADQDQTLAGNNKGNPNSLFGRDRANALTTVTAIRPSPKRPKLQTTLPITKLKPGLGHSPPLARLKEGVREVTSQISQSAQSHAEHPGPSGCRKPSSASINPLIHAGDQ